MSGAVGSEGYLQDKALPWAGFAGSSTGNADRLSSCAPGAAGMLQAKPLPQGVETV